MFITDHALHFSISVIKVIAYNKIAHIPEEVT